ncbi:hypothetical protein BG015_003526 [Linnemannia schmuckeri]|uniref:Myb-like domain-containing protein n=1 Tax=Linnemannia schmuckeri TaxID=64567 RepID=A0A9P5V3Y7_9FUNG|nr:hypothetical protein BG015_003526 [Linnemannia schmuckeri]
MTTICRNNNTRLSLITDTLSRLRLLRTESTVVALRSTQHRCITQTRPGLLKDQTGVNVSATTLDQGQNRDHNCDQSLIKASKTNASTYPEIAVLPLPPQASTTGWKTIRALRKTYPRASRWTDEEDMELLRLVKEGKSVYDIYDNYFPHRTLRAIRNRVANAFRVDIICQHQADGRVRNNGDEDSFVADKVLAKAKSGAPLRRLLSTLEAAMVEKRNADHCDDTIQRQGVIRIVKERKGKWTPEEDALLEQLVRTYIDIPQPTIWNKVSGGSVDGSRLLRDSISCSHRWRNLYPPSSRCTGIWSKEEELRLQKAVSEQLEGKYQVVVDALVGKPVATENPLGAWRPELQQLPDQAGLPILKLGSRRLRMLSWVAISEKVGSRTESNCRFHFYNVYHNGARGCWTKEELGRAREGLDMFGRDYWKIAGHVGTRTPIQVNLMVLKKGWLKKD